MTDMTELIIKIDESKSSLITELVTQLGGEVMADKSAGRKGRKSLRGESNVSPTMLFGKWKDLELDPVTYRDKLWPQKKL